MDLDQTNPVLKPLSPKQENRLIAYLDDEFLELTRGFKKRSEPTTHLPTLPHYLDAAQGLLEFILQIPPVHPSNALRIAFLLRLTNEVLSSIPGYAANPAHMHAVLDWLDDLDQGWVMVLRSEPWRVPTEQDSDDGISDADERLSKEIEAELDDGRSLGLTRKSSVSGTEITRLKSLLLGGVSALEEWIQGPTAKESDVSGVAARLAQFGMQEAFECVFSNTMDELGAIGGYVAEPVSMEMDS